MGSSRDVPALHADGTTVQLSLLLRLVSLEINEKH
jgi:hypothetical protein